MGIATPQPPSDSFLSRSKLQYSIPVSKTTPTADNLNSLTSMSQGFHQGIISFSNGFERSTTYQEQHQQHQQHIAHQSRREKLRVQGFHPHPPLVALEGEEETGDLPAVPVYEAAGMLSEMFNFAPGAATTADLLDQVPSNYRLPRPPAAVANEWYGNRQGFVSGLGSLQDIKSHNSNNHGSEAQHHQISSINADSASAMQLFLMNPQARSPSPSPPASSSSPLHMWLPNPPTPPLPEFHQAESAFASSGIPPAQFSWVPGSGSGGNNASKIGGIMESQGLSLSLSSSLQHLEAAKAEELRMRDGGVYFYNQGGEPSSPSYPLKNLGTHNQAVRLHGGLSQNQQFHVGFGSSVGMVNVLRNSKYVKAAQELLEEFCSVGRGHLKKNRLGNTNPNSNPRGGGAGSSSPSKNLTPLSSADRIEYQRRKVKLISMLDEVDRRYNHYCEQMEMVVNSFDSVMGFGAATPYTALAKKAMSRHFRCLKDAIVCQLKLTCDLLGDKEGTGGSGVTKGETPRLRMLEQSLRQQRAFHQMGMMEQEAWRPQRGLPERSVNILRAWLFEHFLHPYPSDADKHLLARQTGLSRNQVSNWFINARVRLWKPMVEEMYQQEAKDEATDVTETDKNQHAHSSTSAQTPKLTTPETAAVASTSTTAATAAGKRSEFNAHDSDPSHIAINRHRFSESQAQQPISAGATTAMPTTTSAAAAGQVTVLPSVNQRFPTTHESDLNNRLEISDPFQNGSIVPADYGNAGANANLGSTILRFGTTTGDVSLTLGLRHAGNFRDFGGC